MAYTHDYAAFGEHVLNADWMVAEMASRAEKVKAVAEATAPYDLATLTHYRDAFHVEAHTRGGAHHDRAEAVVVNTDDAAVVVEFGNKNTPEHATLRRALDAAR